MVDVALSGEVRDILGDKSPTVRPGGGGDRRTPGRGPEPKKPDTHPREQRRRHQYLGVERRRMWRSATRALTA